MTPCKAIVFTEKGVTFLRRLLTGRSNFYVEKWPPVIILRGHFSTTYTEKNGPKAMNSTEKGLTFLRRIVTGGGSHFYVQKWPWGQFSTRVTSLRYTGAKLKSCHHNQGHVTLRLRNTRMFYGYNVSVYYIRMHLSRVGIRPDFLIRCSI
jgi:hypothetical protein